MSQSKIVTRILTIWALLQSLFVATWVYRLLAGFEVGGVRLPLGALAIAVPIAVAVVCLRRLRGARIVVTAVLAWPAFGAIRVVILRLLGDWPYDYTVSNQVFMIAWFVINAAGLIYLWGGKQGDPYERV